MRDFTSRIPWQSLVHSFNLVGSHDVPRIRTLTYGDEIGMEGTFGEDGRRPMPWDEDDWDTKTLETYRGLISARQRSVALRRGGLRWVHAQGDAIVFLRETLDEVALVHIARAAHEPLVLEPGPLAGIEAGTSLYGPAPTIRKRAVTLSATGPGVSIWTWRPADDGPRHVRRRGR